jgi:hypothetical protein
MKNIKELELLVNFAKSLGQTPDPEMVDQIREHYELQKKIVESVKANSTKDLNTAFRREVIKETTNELVQTSPGEEISSEENIPNTPNTSESVSEKSLAERTAKFISEAPRDSYQQPDPLVVPGDMDAVRGKLKYLEQWISKVSMAGPGSGEVNLRYLDDVYRPNILPQSFLYYNDTNKKFDFTSNITSYVDIENTSRSYGNFYDVSSQPYANVNAGQLINLGIDSGSNRISLQGNGGILFSVAGNYVVNYSFQFVNTDTNQNDINIWLKKNSNNIVDSNSIFTVPAKKNTQTPGKIIATTPITVSVQNNDIVELYWHTDSALVSLQTVAAQGSPGPDIPRTPSSIVTVTKL